MGEKEINPQLAHLIGDKNQRQRLANRDAEMEKQQKAAEEANKKWMASYNPKMCIQLTIPLSGAVYYAHDIREPIAQENTQLLSGQVAIGLRYGRLYSEHIADNVKTIKIHTEVDFIGTGVISEIAAKPAWWDETVARGLKEDKENAKAIPKKN